MTLTQHCML